MIRKNLRLCATLMTVAFLTSCSGAQKSSINPPLAPTASEAAPANPTSVDQLKQLATTQAPKSALPKIGAIVSPRYGIPLARSAVSSFAQGHADLQAQLGRTDVSFSLITARMKRKPPVGISPMSAIEQVCGIIQTTTQYYWNHYVNGVLVSSTYMGSQITGQTPIYCDNGDANEIDYVIETVDCTATPNDASCAYTDWIGGPCADLASAALAGARSIYLTATTSNKGNGGQEYGVVAAHDGSGGHWYSAPIAGNATSVDFAAVLDHMPPGFVVDAIIHVHPELYPSDDAEVDDTTHNHFSQADEDVAYDYQVPIYVVIGGQTDMFSWTPPPKPTDPTAPKPNYTTNSDSGRLGSVNDGNPGC